MKEDTTSRIHPGIEQAQAQLQQGRISRRDFLRVATLLGASLPFASVLAACRLAIAGRSDLCLFESAYSLYMSEPAYGYCRTDRW